MCKTSPVHVATTPRIPHDRSVVGKAGAMLELPAGAAEVVEASQVSEYQQLVYELITFKTCTCRSKVLDVGGSKSRGHLPDRGQLAPEGICWVHICCG